VPSFFLFFLTEHSLPEVCGGVNNNFSLPTCEYLWLRVSKSVAACFLGRVHGRSFGSQLSPLPSWDGSFKKGHVGLAPSPFSCPLSSCCCIRANGLPILGDCSLWPLPLLRLSRHWAWRCGLRGTPTAPPGPRAAAAGRALLCCHPACAGLLLRPRQWRTSCDVT